MWTNVSGTFDKWYKRDSYYIGLSDVGAEYVEAIIEYCKNKLKEAVKNCDYDAVASIAGDIKILTTAFQDAKNQADEEFRAYLEEQKQIEESDADAE